MSANPSHRSIIAVFQRSDLKVLHNHKKVSQNNKIDSQNDNFFAKQQFRGLTPLELIRQMRTRNGLRSRQSGGSARFGID